MPSITGINGAGSGLPEPAGFGVLGIGHGSGCGSVFKVWPSLASYISE